MLVAQDVLGQHSQRSSLAPRATPQLICSFLFSSWNEDRPNYYYYFYHYYYHYY